MVIGPYFYLHIVNSLVQNCAEIDVEGVLVPQPPRLHLSAEKLDSHGAFLMDAGDHMMMYVCHNISSQFCSAVLGVPSFSAIPEEMVKLLITYAHWGIFGMMEFLDVDHVSL
jgi:Vesicle coat complex COPII, subunit SEC24/subunit SFB2/subunit SFB3